MTSEAALDIFQEFLFLFLVFDLFLVYAIIRGRQAMINLIMAFYLALLVMVEFPYDDFLGVENASYYNLGMFILFTFLALLVMNRIMPEPFKENKFESISKKMLLALGGTILISIYSYHVLFLNTLIDLGTPVDQVFGPPELFFWWLLVPLLILFVV